MIDRTHFWSAAIHRRFRRSAESAALFVRPRRGRHSQEADISVDKAAMNRRFRRSAESAAPFVRPRRRRHSQEADISVDKAAMNRRTPKRRGVVLVLVLVVVVVLALAGFTFSELMLVEHKAADLSRRQAQARLCADSGLQMVRLFMAQPVETIDQLGGWYELAIADHPGVLVADSDAAVERGRFAVVAPTVDEAGNRDVRFGLEDESARLNMMTLLETENSSPDAARQILLQLPNMTEDTADAILDWIDSDDQQREFGAEIDYYTDLDPPYAPRNGPLETVEELLLVRGVTPALLFGADANHNGIIDPDETADDALAGLDNSGGLMDRGWAAYLTLYSRETNLRPDGQPKIDLNSDDLEQLYTELEQVLGAEAAAFVVAYRQYGPYSGDRTGGQSEAPEIVFEKQAEHELESVLDLIGAKVEISTDGGPGGSGQGGPGGSGPPGGGRPPGGGGAPGGGPPPGDSGQQDNDEPESIILESPFRNTPGTMGSFLPKLLDNCTTDTRSVIPGRININQAPRVVLAGIPEMPPDAVEQILAQREPNPTGAEESRRHATWILDAGIVTLEQMKALLPYVTGGGSVYRAQIVGYFDGGGPSARIEALLDTTQQPPTVMFWRDLSHLGRGHTLDVLGTESTR